MIAPVFTSPGSPAPQTMTPFADRISTRTRRRSATAAGKAHPAVDYGFGPGGAPRISQTSCNTPASPRVPAGSAPTLADPPARTVPLPSDHDHEERTKTSLLRLTHFSGDTPTMLNCGSRIPSPVFRFPTGSANSTQSRRATPRYVTSLSTRRRPCHPTSWHATPRTSFPLCQTSRSLRARVDYIQPTTTSS